MPPCPPSADRHPAPTIARRPPAPPTRAPVDAAPSPAAPLPSATGAGAPVPSDPDPGLASVSSLPAAVDAGTSPVVPVGPRSASAGADAGAGGRTGRTGRAVHPSSSRSAAGREGGHEARAGRRIAHRALRALPAGVRWRPELGDGLEMDVTARGRAVQLHLAGDLDVASAGRFTAAVSWLRRTGRLVIVDTRRLQFVGLAGDRALQDAAGYDELGRPDPHVVVLVGPAVARFRDVLSRLTATATSATMPGGGAPGPSPAPA